MQPLQELLLAAGLWAAKTHEEIWVYSNGFWQKNRDLWEQVQKADWADVILDKQRKEDLRKDVYSFFKSEAIYKELAIPWKVPGSP